MELESPPGASETLRLDCGLLKAAAWNVRDRTLRSAPAPGIRLPSFAVPGLPLGEDAGDLGHVFRTPGAEWHEGLRQAVAESAASSDRLGSLGRLNREPPARADVGHPFFREPPCPRAADPHLGRSASSHWRLAVVPRGRTRPERGHAPIFCAPAPRQRFHFQRDTCMHPSHAEP